VFDYSNSENELFCSDNLSTAALMKICEIGLAFRDGTSSNNKSYTLFSLRQFLCSYFWVMSLMRA